MQECCCLIWAVHSVSNLTSVRTISCDANTDSLSSQAFTLTMNAETEGDAPAAAQAVQAKEQYNADNLPAAFW